MLVDGDHHIFSQNNAISAEDTTFYQRFLKGVGIGLHSINTAFSDPSSEFSGVVGTITVKYPSGTSLNGLTESDVSVYMDCNGDGTVDEIQVNNAEYSGHTDTFGSDGRHDMTVAGEVRLRSIGDHPRKMSTMSLLPVVVSRYNSE